MAVADERQKVFLGSIGDAFLRNRIFGNILTINREDREVIFKVSLSKLDESIEEILKLDPHVTCRFFRKEIKEEIERIIWCYIIEQLQQ